MVYDDVGRLLSETWFAADGVTVVDTRGYTHDTAGNVLSASSNAGTYTMTYDDAGRMKTQAQPNGITLTFGYDENGNRTLVQDSFGGKLESVYDRDNRLISRRMSGDGQKLRIDITYTPDNKIATETRYGDLVGVDKLGFSTYLYDFAGRLTNIQHQDGSGTIIADYVYAYDSASRLISKTENGVVTNYNYDDLNQLTADDGRTFSYDATGNRTNPGYATGPGNRLITDGEWNYFYDNEGNTVKKIKIVGGETWTYEYDHLNHMTQAIQRTSDGGSLIQQVDFAYDVFNNRIEKVVVNVPAGTTQVDRFAYAVGAGAGGEGLSEVWVDLNQANRVKRRYMHGDKIDQLYARTGPGNKQAAWYFTDHQGAIRDVMDLKERVRDHVDYDAHGNILLETNANFGDRYKYTGREYERELDLYYYRDNFYNARVGRFQSEDKMPDPAANLYPYVKNSPTNFTDPSGKYIFGRPPESARALSTLRDWTKGLAVSALGRNAHVDRGKLVRHDESLEAITVTAFGVPIPLLKNIVTKTEKLDRIELFEPNWHVVQSILRFTDKYKLPDHAELEKILSKLSTAKEHILYDRDPDNEKGLLQYDVAWGNPVSGPLKIPFLNDFVDEIKKWPRTIEKLWGVVDNFRSVAPKIVAAIQREPIKLAETAFKGISSGVTQFVKNLGSHLPKSFLEWLTGGELKESTGENAQQARTTFEKIGEYLLSTIGVSQETVLTALFSKINPKYVALFEKVYEHVESIINAPEKITELFQKLEGFTPQSLLQKVKEDGVSYVTNYALGRLTTAVAQIFAPGIGVIEKVFSGLSWAFDTASTLADVANNLIEKVDSFIEGNSTDVAMAVELGMRKLLPTALKLVAGMVKLADLPIRVKTVLKKIEAWVKVKLEAFFAKVADVIEKTLGKVIGKDQGLVGEVLKVKIGTEEHHLWVATDGKDVKLMFGSKPREVTSNDPLLHGKNKVAIAGILNEFKQKGKEAVDKLAQGKNKGADKNVVQKAVKEGVQAQRDLVTLEKQKEAEFQKLIEEQARKCSPASHLNISTGSANSKQARKDITTYAQRSNIWLRENGPVRIVSTSKTTVNGRTLRDLADAAAERERRRAERTNKPYTGQAGHVPDTAITGL